MAPPSDTHFSVDDETPPEPPGHAPEKEELLTICLLQCEAESDPDEWDLERERERRRLGDSWLLSDPPDKLSVKHSEPESVRRPKDKLDFLRALFFLLLRDPVVETDGDECRPVLVVVLGVGVETLVGLVDVGVAPSAGEALLVVMASGVPDPKAWLSLVGVSGVVVRR